MRVVIICAGVNPALRELDEHTPAALFPLADRPVLQHVVEFFAHQGVRDFDFILNHLPEQIEAYAGDGARWGCRIRYHLVAGHDQSWKALRVICAGLNEEIALATAESFPAAPWATDSSGPSVLLMSGSDAPVWFGWAAFHSSRVKELFSGNSQAAINEQVKGNIRSGVMKPHFMESWFSFTTPSEILTSQRTLLGDCPSTIRITGTQAEKGAWIGRNSSIHPTAKLVPPFYIGPDTRIGARTQIGPFATIGEKCIIDEDSVVEDSIVTAGTYVGQGLELEQTILDRNRLVNAGLDAAYLISEAFIAGCLVPARRFRFAQQTANRLLGLLLLLLFSPLVLVLLIAVLFNPRLRLRKRPFVTSHAPGTSGEWPIARCLRVESRGKEAEPGLWSHFIFRFLPGLFSVVAGSIALCGVPERSAEELRELPSDWRAICLQSVPGLVSEEVVVCGPEASSEERYSAEAYYFARKSFPYDLKLLFRYLERVVMQPPAHTFAAPAHIKE